MRLTFLCCLLASIACAQHDTISKGASDIFDRIAKSVKEFKPDTTTPPDDKLTKKIIELRSLRGGFNINEAIDYKIEEDQQKKEVPASVSDDIAAYFRDGNGKKWLDNATIWIYRRHFSYHEIKKLVTFYKTTAGQKMAMDFPIIMMQSLSAAEMIKDLYIQQQKASANN